MEIGLEAHFASWEPGSDAAPGVQVINHEDVASRKPGCGETRQRIGPSPHQVCDDDLTKTSSGRDGGVPMARAGRVSFFEPVARTAARQ